MGLKLNTASSGSVTIEPANTASNYTLTVPAQTGTVVATDASGNVGIGTSSPSYRLVVKGGNDNSTLIDNDGSRYTSIYVSNSGTVKAFSIWDNTNTVFNIGTQAASSALALYTAGTERARIDSSGNLLFNSGYGSVATAYGCRAWVNFNGTGTVAIRSSGNVSSITDNGAGDYTVNFTNAMPDTNYATILGSSQVDASSANGSYQILETVAPTTTSVRTLLQNGLGTNQDGAYMSAAIFR